jgi:hypothetical protein
VPGCEGKGVAATNGDCDDGDIAVHPGADEIPDDAIDQDCDGGEICYADSDGDGFGSSIQVASVDIDCADEGEADNPEDCLDAGADGAATFPGRGRVRIGLGMHDRRRRRRVRLVVAGQGRDAGTRLQRRRRE